MIYDIEVENMPTSRENPAKASKIFSISVADCPRNVESIELS
jgi:hypothetical protein